MARFRESGSGMPFGVGSHDVGLLSVTGMRSSKYSRNSHDYNVSTIRMLLPKLRLKSTDEMNAY